MTLLTVEDISKRFWRRSAVFGGLRFGATPLVQAVRNVSLAIEAGQTLALVGPSGSGKSTIARLVAGLIKPDEGSIRLGPTEAYSGSRSQRRQHASLRQMVFQDPYSSLTPGLSVGSILDEARQAGDTRGDKRGRLSVSELLENVGLSTSDAEKRVHEFSGGERQRIAIARALAPNPALLICDEPTSALDVSVQAHILNLLKDLQAAHGLAMLFISHDLAVVAQLADHIAVIDQGCIVERGLTRDVIIAPRHSVTTTLVDQTLANSIPRSAGNIPGNLPRKWQMSAQTASRCSPARSSLRSSKACSRKVSTRASP